MARRLVRYSYVIILGKIWLPMAPASLRKDLSSYDIDNIRGYSRHLSGDETGPITREGFEHWLMLNSGDFSSVDDFTGSIEDGDTTLDFPWAKDESEINYYDTLPSED